MSDIAEHLPTLKQAVIDTGAKKVLELGVRQGESTKAFLEGCLETGGELISVDIADCRKVSNNPNWQFIQCDDKDLDFNEPIDILFIDTSHTHEHTLFELEKFSPLVKPKGIIFLHDTMLSGAGVMSAIEEFLRRNPDKWKFNNYPNCNGLGVLEKI